MAENRGKKPGLKIKGYAKCTISGRGQAEDLRSKHSLSLYPVICCPSLLEKGRPRSISSREKILAQCREARVGGAGSTVRGASRWRKSIDPHRGRSMTFKRHPRHGGSGGMLTQRLHERVELHRRHAVESLLNSKKLHLGDHVGVSCRLRRSKRAIRLPCFPPLLAADMPIMTATEKRLLPAILQSI